jgi:hypothetical protein
MRIPQTPDRVKEAPVHALRAMFAGVGQALLLPGRVLRRGGHEHAAAVSSGEVSSPALTTETAPAGTATATATLEADQATVPAPRPAEPSTSAPAATPEASTPAKTSAAKASTTKASSTKAAPAKAGTTKTSTAKTSTAKAAAAKSGAAKTSAAKSSTAKAAAAKDGAVEAAAAAPAAAEAGPTTVKEEIAKPAAATAELPIPNYPDLTIASLRARMRGLDIGQLGALLDYERSHDGRENVITMFERRIIKLRDEGAAAS